MDDVALRFEQVDLARGRRPVVAGASFVVHAGEAWCLIGANGAGKSTLLAAALGAVRPVAGRVSRAPDLESRRGVGYVPQRCTLDPTLPTTVEEFVALGLSGLALGRAEQRLRVAEALAAVALAAHGRRSFWTHSDGQRQRVLLARALARRPRFLLLDEPTSALDPAAADRFWELVARRRAAGGLTVLCATHDLAAVPRLATHVAVCVPGMPASTVETMPASELEPSGALQRAFGRHPQRDDDA